MQLYSSEDTNSFTRCLSVLLSNYLCFGYIENQLLFVLRRALDWSFFGWFEMSCLCLIRIVCMCAITFDLVCLHVRGCLSRSPIEPLACVQSINRTLSPRETLSLIAHYLPQSGNISLVLRLYVCLCIFSTLCFFQSYPNMIIQSSQMSCPLQVVFNGLCSSYDI